MNEQETEKQTEKTEQEKTVKTDSGNQKLFYFIVGVVFIIFFAWVFPKIPVNIAFALIGVLVFVFFVFPFLTQIKREEASAKYKPMRVGEFVELERLLARVPGFSGIRISGMSRDKRHSANEAKRYHFRGTRVLASGVVEPLMFSIPATMFGRERNLDALEPNTIRIEKKNFDWSGDRLFSYSPEQNVFNVRPVRVQPDIKHEDEEEEEEEE